MRALTLVLAALACLAAGLGAASPERLQHYELGVSEGLANNSIYCILQDRRGYMWFGTFGGLSRYDGETFANFRPKPDGHSLAASVVFALVEDGSGSIWVGTDGGGLARYDPAADSFELFRAGSEESGALSSDRILSLAIDWRGRIVAGGGDGVVNILDPATRKVTRIRAPHPAPIRCIAVDSEKRIWAGTEGGGMLRWDEEGGELLAFTHSGADPGSPGFDTVRCLLRDSRNRLWAGLGNGEVELVEGKRFVHARSGAGQPHPAQAVRSLAEDPDGTIWVGYEDAGIGILDPATMLLRSPGDASSSMVRALYRDRKGLMWVGLKEGGLRVYSLRSAFFTRYRGLADGRPITGLRGMAEGPGGRIYIGTDGLGLLSMDPATGSIQVVPGMPPDRAARKVYAVLIGRDGTVWAGTDGGGLIARSGDGRIRRYRHDQAEPGSLASDVVWSLFEDHDGSLWVGTEGGGLDLLSPGAPAFIHHRPDPAVKGSIRGSSIRAVFRDSRGRLWAGAWDGGLSRLDPGSAGFKSFGPDAGNPSSLGDASVNCIFEDSRGRIWVGTGGSGIARLDEDSERFVHNSVEEGLAGATVYGILQDSGGGLWISTATGLSRYIEGSGGFFNYGPEDGLASAQLYQNSFLRGSDGEIWLGGMGGLTRFDPARIPWQGPVPDIAISDVDAGELHLLSGSADPAKPIDLAYDNAGLSLRIAVLDFVAPTRNRYAMSLSGRQSGWTQLGLSNIGSIAPLPPGEYLLRVKGANGNGIWNDEGTALKIIVHPPVWATWWFRLLAATFVAAAVAAAIAVRISSLHKRNALLVNFARHVEAAREEERTNASREVHDEIGQHLAVLNLQAYWLATHPDAEPESRKTRVGDMTGAIAAAMAAVKSVSTRLRPVALDSLSLGETVKWYLRDFERRSGIACRCEAGSLPAELPNEIATGLFRVLQESLSNVARHAGARSVQVRLRVEGGFLGLEVADDGRGIEGMSVRAPDSFGIIGMRERCAAFGGSLSVTGEAGRGTVVVARIPLADKHEGGT
jgi:signal transduction histidine kinase/ligand-binding sensor domain-containing protein